MDLNRTYRTCEIRNSGEAYRRFRANGLAAAVHETLQTLMRHKLIGGAIALMGVAGLIGCLITFWPR